LRDRLAQEKKYLEDEINLDNRFEDIVAKARAWRRLLREIATSRADRCQPCSSRANGNGQECWRGPSIA